MRKYTVYCHTNKINGKRYVGITKQVPERRWQNGHGYDDNIHFRNAIQKYGWEEFSHEILFTGLNKEQAEQKEIELIAKWDLTNRDCGYNRAPGGHLNNGFSDETRKQISDSLKKTYKLNGHHSRGRKMSDACKERMTAANEKRKKPIIQYTSNGEFVAQYDSMREMERVTGFKRAAVKANADGVSTQSYGFIWKYE